MPMRLSQPDSVNVLISDAHWAWPRAVAEIFQPRGINALLANSAEETVRLITNNKIHLAILDMAMSDLSGMQALKIIRKHDLLLPCILLAQHIDARQLAQALTLNVFSVLGKPVDMKILANRIDRLFVKYYASDIFSNFPQKVPKNPHKNTS